MALDPSHRQELETCGVSEEMIEQCGFWSATPGEAGELLAWPRPAPSRALVLPYRDGQGQVVLNRLKLDQPRTVTRDGQDEVVKYEAPRGSRLRLYVPPPVYPRLASPEELLIITEGEKKAASAASRGLAAVGIAGVFCWKDREKSVATGRDELLPDFDEIVLTGRRVAIVFDSDAATKPPVKKAEARLAAALRARGAVVTRVALPAGPGGGKQGLDDFLVAQGAAGVDELRRLIEESSRPPGGSGSAGCRRRPPPPIETAGAFLTAEFDHGGEPTLRRHRQVFHRWQQGRYEPVSDEEVEAQILRHLAAIGGPGLASPAYAHAVLRCLQALVMLDGTLNPPVWLGGPANGPDYNHIALSNGVLGLGRLFGGADSPIDCLLPASPRWFSPVVLDYGFDERADCPQWQAFLDRVFGGDAERVLLAQEVFGLCLTPDTSFQRFVLLYGEGSNGKSVFCDLLSAFLGEPNVSHVPLEAFAQRFALTATLGKLANIASEVGEIDRVAEGLLKAFVAGDAMTFDRKNRDPVEARPTARLIFSTNNLPRFADRSMGLWRRLLLLPFLVQIPPEEQDRHLADRLRGELPGILNWALVGLARLRQQGRFTEPAICREALQEYRDDSNPTRCFLELHCRPDPAAELPSARLYERYAEWMRGYGYRVLAEAPFGREVRRAFPMAQRRKIGGRAERYYAYQGITFG
jgi:P4 family phage/plasmid primase-like protien